jgi:hypothetical protein
MYNIIALCQSVSLLAKEGLFIISVVFKSFCHSHASGNPEIVPSYIFLDSRSRIKYGTSFTGMTTFDTRLKGGNKGEPSTLSLDGRGQGLP